MASKAGSQLPCAAPIQRLWFSRRGVKKFFQDKRTWVLILLSVLAVIKSAEVGAGFLLWIAGGVLTASTLDYAINSVIFKRRILPRSAAISGFIVAGILDYQQPWFVSVAFPAIAILSKHIIRNRSGHIFNPANFGLFAAVLLKIPLTWAIESNIPLIVVGGIVIACALKKVPHVLGFLTAFGVPVAFSGQNPFLLMSYFFLFIMLIEPKTSGHGMVRGFVFGALSGAFCFISFKFFPAGDMFVCSLMAANALRPAVALLPGP